MNKFEVKSRLLIVLLFLALSVSGPAHAETPNKLVIDCNHSDLDNTTTNNTITVIFYSGGVEIGRDSGKPSCDAVSDTTYKIVAGTSADEIIVKTNGSDGFFMDELFFYNADNYEDSTSANQTNFIGAIENLVTPVKGYKKSWGQENGGGYCLSTDPTDADRTWAGKVSGCHTSIRFSVATGDVIPTDRPTDKPKPPEPKQEYKISVDCYDPQIKNGSTNDTIKVVFIMGKGEEIEKQLNTNCSASRNAVTSIQSEDFLRGFSLETDGNDGFWMDQLIVSKVLGTKVGIFQLGRDDGGEDGGKGVCLSTDPTDADRTWAGKVDYCRKKYVWNTSMQPSLH